MATLTVGPFDIDINTTDSFFDIFVDLAIDPVTKIRDYTWSVQATDSLGNQSAPSAAAFTINLNVPVIELVFPLGIQTTAVSIFQWRTTGDIAALTYHLQIDDSIDFATPLEDVTLPNTGATGSTRFHSFSVPLDGNYNWRVRGISGLGVTGGFTEAPFTVDLDPPPTPTLLSPGNGARISDNSPTFEWTDVVDTSGVTYNLQVIKSGFFFVDSGDLADTQFTSQPLDDGTYLWRVQAVDGANRLGTFSAIFTVTIDTTPPAAPALLLPVDNDFFNNQNRQVLFSWNASTSPDIDQYRLQVVRAGAPFQAPFVINALVATTQSTGDLTAELDGAFNWRVGALDTATPFNETDPASLVVRTFTLDTDTVAVQHKCPSNCSAEMSPVWSTMVSDGDIVDATGDRRVGGLSASTYLLTVSL